MTRKLPSYLTEEEVNQILGSVDRENGKFAFRNRLMIEVMFWGGLRVSENANLDVGDIEFDRGCLNLRNTKGGKSRTVPLKRELLSRLKQYINSTRAGKAKYLRDDPVFLSASGKRLTTRRIEQVVKKHADLLDIGKRITPHTFRHSFAVNCAKHDIPGKYIQDMLGHEDFGTTEIYLKHHLSLDEMRKQYEKLEGVKE